MKGATFLYTLRLNLLIYFTHAHTHTYSMKHENKITLKKNLYYLIIFNTKTVVPFEKQDVISSGVISMQRNFKFVDVGDKKSSESKSMLIKFNWGHFIVIE